MWECVKCGCRAIAHDLGWCPHCGEEKEMPRSVTGAVPSHQDALPGEPGYIEPEIAPAPADASAGAQEEAAADPEPEPETDPEPEPETPAPPKPAKPAEPRPH